jgi:hypothetical protein
MTRRRALRSIGAATALLLLAGCTARPAPAPAPHRDPAVPPGTFQLVAFDSCADALVALKTAAKASVGPGGFTDSIALSGERTAISKSRPDAMGVPAAAPAGAAPAEAAEHSSTNTHEIGVDEPDLIKTDGRRIVTVNRAVLRVVDPATRRITGQVDLGTGPDDPGRWAQAELLLHGDRALVLIAGNGGPIPIVSRADIAKPRPADEIAPRPAGEIAGPRLILVDLAGPPRILSTYRIDGGLVDARQVGQTVRVVIRSTPRLDFSGSKGSNADQLVAANRELIEKSTMESWLPRFSVTSAEHTTAGQVGCDRLSRPASYSGGSMITMLGFDLGASTMSDGDPITVAADGSTVYSNGERLYLANDPRWRFRPLGKRATDSVKPDSAQPDSAKPAEPATEIYQFDIAGPGRPRYVTSALVPGVMINQYAMSEWNGHLRVATTSEQGEDDPSKSSSTVYVLRADGKTLAETGRVTGLGKGERIYAVRFVGATGYVVTFRQTDPLYTLDLSNPSTPRVTGELKINGYSAYLHPLDNGRLIGVGQEATGQGRALGTQISLFDASDPARPVRLGQHHVESARSEAESDPHAFLYWPADRLLVVPVSGPARSSVDASALRVDDRGFTELGLIDHPTSGGKENAYSGSIRRSLVVGGVLWTFSDAGLKATSIATMKTLDWLPMA